MAFAEQSARLLRPGGIAVFLDVADAADPARREPDQLAVRAFTEVMRNDEKWLTTPPCSPTACSCGPAA